MYKKYFIFLLCCVMIFTVVGCTGSGEESKEILNESALTEKLNEELYAYFNKTNDKNTESDVGSNLFIDRIKEYVYTYKTKYLLSLKENLKETYFCAYLSKDIIGILNDIQVNEPDGNPGWYVWLGIDFYLKKYEFAIEHDIINVNEYSLKWVEFSSKDEIKDVYDDFFLVCISKCSEVNVVNYANNTKEVKKVFWETNPTNLGLYDELKQKEGFLLLTDLTFSKDYISTLDLYNLVYYHSFEYKVYNNIIYIASNHNRGDLIVKLKLCDYVVFENVYFYKLSDVLKG